MRLERGTPAPERREGRARLSVRDPRLDSVLGSICIDGFNIDETRRWGNSLLHARDQWADLNRGGRRYSDRDTAQAQNSLVRRGPREIRS